MKKTTKILLSVGALMLAGVVAFGAYRSRWIRFNDNQFGESLTGLNPATDPNAGRVGFICNEKHGFGINDLVRIEQDPGFTNAHYNGTHRVTWISTDGLAFIIAKHFGEPTPPEGGKVQLVKKAK